MAGLGAVGLYDLIQGATTKLDLPVSVAHLCPKGTSRLPQPWSLAQQPKSEAIVPKPKGGVSVQ